MIDCNYDTGNDMSSVRPLNARYYSDEVGLQAYSLCARDIKGKLLSMTLSGGTGTTKPVNPKGFRPDKIYFYNGSAFVAKNSLLTNNYIFEAMGTSVANYAFNADATAYVDIYLKGTLGESDGLFYLSTGVTDFYKFVPYNATSITLTSYFTSGYYYIYVGRTYSTKNYYWLSEVNPLFYFDGTNLVEVKPLATKALNVMMTSGVAATSASITLDTSAKRTYNIYSGTTASITLAGTVQNPGWDHYALFKNTGTGSMVITPKAGWITTDATFTVPASGFLELSWVCVGGYLVLTGSKAMTVK